MSSTAGEKNNNPGNNGGDVIGATYLDHTSTLVHMNIGVAHTGVAHSVMWSFGLWFCSSAAHCCQSSSSAPAWPRSKITHYYQLIYTFIYIFNDPQKKSYTNNTPAVHTHSLWCILPSTVCFLHISGSNKENINITLNLKFALKFKHVYITGF